MEKRLVLFILVSVLIFGIHGFVLYTTNPPPKDIKRAVDAKEKTDPAKKVGKTQKADQHGPAEKEDTKGQEKDKEREEKDKEREEKLDSRGDSPTEPSKDGPRVKPTNKGESTASDKADKKENVRQVVPEHWVTLGSFAPGSPYRLLVTLTNRGAAIEQVELVERRKSGTLRYRDLDRRFGYLGLQCRQSKDGCEVKAVGPGTPAATARPADGTFKAGILANDVIKTADGRPINNSRDFDAFLARTEPGQAVKLGVTRALNGNVRTIEFATTLAHRPLPLIRPEPSPGIKPTASFLMGLARLGKSELKFGQLELPGFTSLRRSNWTLERPSEDQVVFRLRVSTDGGEKGEELEIVKRYQIVKTPKEQVKVHTAPTYHLRMSITIRNLGQQAREVAYLMDGPNGLPTEGWWYSNKIHPSWGSAGARDVIWRVHGKGHNLRSASQIYKDATKDPDDPFKPILTDRPSLEDRSLDYIGVDTQYFSAVLLAGSVKKPSVFACRQAYAMPVGPVTELKGREIKTLNTSFRLITEATTLEPGKSLSKQYHLFLGPKSPPLLDPYGLAEIIEYGWFGWIAKPMSKVLHFFYFLIWNYGLAIILLTVLVRGAMFPIGRKAARNAQMMQELAPQLKQLKEKYKNDLEKQAQAQRELWKKHNFNPLGGCWLMFLQLPIFIGLYRCLSVDIELRQAPLIPGLQWCANLAGPDMFWHWENLGLAMLTAKTGWLGPYLNILPIVTVVLFIVQQKMFTPPATDDQTQMQQKMMKYMMLFMGVLFFKVPAGLCIYFIASSMWGIAERKLLPKPELKSAQGGGAPADGGRGRGKDDGKSGRKGGNGKPGRGGRPTPVEPKKSLLQRFEDFQQRLDQKAKQTRASDPPPRKKKGKR